MNPSTAVNPVLIFSFLSKMSKNYRTNRSANRNNESLNREVLEDAGSLFGRATKALGHRRFQVETVDKKGNVILIDASIRGKILWVNVGDVLILGKNDASYEILGACDKKTLKRLRDAKRLPESLFASNGLDGEDDLFDRNEELPEDEVGVQEKPKVKAPVPEPVKETEEVDIDEI